MAIWGEVMQICGNGWKTMDLGPITDLQTDAAARTSANFNERLATTAVDA